ncbi:hypothetical protein CNMCM5793_002290 [Aspergillus hiratsukae]|uniref:Retrotransposon gag domain-containing protein n=1 Tax=Aspergillus hiratsukae TaxID=1194566 RepID=A0A8H6PCJ1_9EURO|nr:hypothetical protein CNMCM5793_002290 [Aspergillus hiratsukae]KAF7166181.1 hypothetical protein CNMCM6106_002105 [Aspergillus hiratsukae]
MSLKLEIPIFHGPATAVAVSRWFNLCEIEFEAYEDDNSRVLQDRQKIREAARHFGNESEMVDDRSKGLKDWYNVHVLRFQQATWDSFRDEVKDYLMGPTWRLQILKGFFTYAQGSESLDEFFREFSRLRHSISRSSNLRPIDDQTYNSLLALAWDP